MIALRHIAKMSSYSLTRPVVVVLGATGVGKSKLAIEIAKQFNGEVISADSMQIYKGLDIITNKVTSEECDGIRHHMIGFLNPLDNYNIVDFRNDALEVIDKLHDEGKLPVVVGGTHYYVESILWKVLIGSSNESKRKCCDSSENISPKKERVNSLSDQTKCDNSSEINTNDKSVFSNRERSNDSDDVSANCDMTVSNNLDYRKILEKFSNDELLLMLQEVDPEIAGSYHPNNRRKIIRSLEIWEQTGVRHSEHLRRQAAQVGVSDLGGALRFDRVSVLWITCDQDVLDKRLDSRVDNMIGQGLIEELTQFNSTFNRVKLDSLRDESGQVPPGALAEHYQTGVFQCIGFKEFHDFLSLDNTADNGGDTPTDSDEVFGEAVEKMKLRTRQYSRRQIKWIKNRFLRRERMKLPVYCVDASDVSMWTERVFDVAARVVRDMLNGTPSSVSPMVLGQTRAETKTKHVCDVCERIFIGDIVYETHLKSKKHEKMLKRLHQSQRRESDGTGPAAVAATAVSVNAEGEA